MTNNDQINVLMTLIAAVIPIFLGYFTRRLKKLAEVEIDQIRRRQDEENHRLAQIEELYRSMPMRKQHDDETIGEEEIRANFQQFMEFYGYTEPQLRSVFIPQISPLIDPDKPKNDNKIWKLGDDGEIFCEEDEY